MLPPLIPLLVPPGQGPSVPFIDGHLHLGLLVEPSLRAVTEDELLAWDHPFVRLCDHAVLGLRGRTRDHQLEPLEAVPGVWRVQSEDGLAASRMLCLDDLLRPWPLEGVIVACPTPDQLLLVPMQGHLALPALRATMRLLARWNATEEALSDQLFWCDRDGVWNHVPVRHHADGGVDIMPVPGLESALARALSLDLGPFPGEA